jgi:hypothetical protein
MAYWYNKTFAVILCFSWNYRWPLEVTRNTVGGCSCTQNNSIKTWPVKFGNLVLETVPCFNFFSLLRFSSQSAPCFAQCRTLNCWILWRHARFPAIDVLIAFCSFFTAKSSQNSQKCNKIKFRSFIFIRCLWHKLIWSEMLSAFQFLSNVREY